MRMEIHSAANFLVQLVRLNNSHVVEGQLEQFKATLMELLRRRYRDHWFPERPFKGSGYRCIRINGKMDPLIAQAGDKCGFSHRYLRSLFPSELTMWIDPKEVSYRIGENGSICVLFEEKKDGTAVLSESFSEPAPAPSPRPMPPKDTSAAGQGAASCKDSLRSFNFFMDPRTAVQQLEPFAAYVSS